MKVGDLVTLSAYATQTVDLNPWGVGRWVKNPPVGIVVKVKDMGHRSYFSKNENVRYYVKWVHAEGPLSRHGTSGFAARNAPFFFRKDLKFVSKR